MEYSPIAGPDMGSAIVKAARASFMIIPGYNCLNLQSVWTPVIKNGTTRLNPI